MSKEEASGGEEGEQQTKQVKDLETKLQQYEQKLEEYERELEVASKDLKIKAELCQKSEECIKERDRFIKKLMEKLEAKEKELNEAKTTHAEYLSKVMNDKDSWISQLMKRTQILKEKLNKKEAEVEEVTTHAVYLSKEMNKKDDVIVKLMEKIQSLEEKLEQQIQETKEKLDKVQKICREEATVACAQITKKTQRDMEEQLQLVRQENTQTGLLVRTMMNEFQNVVKNELLDMKRGIKQTAQEMVKNMEEQGAAIRNEVQSTKKELKDEMATKMDEQAAEMTQKIKELQTDIQEAINPAPEPKEEITYSPCEVNEAPHDIKTSQCAISNSSTNCGIDSIPAQDSHGTSTAEFV